MITIKLWDLEHPVLLFKAETGVVYQNQVGGTACLQKSLEGFIVPLPLGGHVAHCEDPLRDFACMTSPDAFNRALSLLELLGLNDSLHIDMTELEGRSVSEAWVPVVVTNATRFAALDELVGRRAILTYENSD